jgi:hypothetical protein
MMHLPWIEVGCQAVSVSAFRFSGRSTKAATHETSSYIVENIAKNSPDSVYETAEPEQAPGQFVPERDKNMIDEYPGQAPS